jgi:hypothetical protein
VDPEMSLSHLRNIFLYWHGLRIYFGSGYIFLVCRGVGGPSFSKKLGISYFQGLKAHFQIWKCALFEMKNSNKIGEKSEKK